MNRKQLAAALGISPSMVTRLAKRGMPTDSVDRAKRWRNRHIEPGRMKSNRADTFDATPPAICRPTAPVQVSAQGLAAALDAVKQADRLAAIAFRLVGSVQFGL